VVCCGCGRKHLQEKKNAFLRDFQVFEIGVGESFLSKRRIDNTFFIL